MSAPSKLEQLEEFAADLGMTEQDLREFAAYYPAIPVGASMNRFELFHAMIYRIHVTLMDANQNHRTGLITAIEMEDGSGYCFNVRLACQDGQPPITVFVRSPKH